MVLWLFKGWVRTLELGMQILKILYYVNKTFPKFDLSPNKNDIKK